MAAAPVRATFWLLDSPEAPALQGRHHPDGYGLAVFEDDGTPHLQKRPAAAYEDELFALEARHERARTFVAHVRYASVGRASAENTHPFEQERRVFAHIGHIEGLDELEAQLGDYLPLLQGETDSERFFALITKEIDGAHGNVSEGLARAARWVAEELPVYSLNCVLATASGMWALRYPDARELFVLEREGGGDVLEAASASGRIRVQSEDLAAVRSVLFSSEPMDDDPGWRLLEPGEMVHVDADLSVRSRIALEDPPAHQLDLEDLDPRAAEAQRLGAELD
jgi:glutamine amidotransferase